MTPKTFQLRVVKGAGTPFDQYNLMKTFSLMIRQKFSLSDISVKAGLHDHTVKALLSPRGAYLILDLPEGGLIERGAY